MWLLGRLAPDFKTIADFRKDNTRGICLVCRDFALICRKLNLFSDAFIAIDGSKFKAVNSRGRNYTRKILKNRFAQIDKSIDKYLNQIISADRLEAPVAKGFFGKHDFIYNPEKDAYLCPDGEIAIYRFSREEKGKIIRRYWTSACPACPIKSQCTTGKYRRISRWEHEAVLDLVEERTGHEPERMAARRNTVEHPFGTIKFWMEYHCCAVNLILSS